MNFYSVLLCINKTKTILKLLKLLKLFFNINSILKIKYKINFYYAKDLNGCHLNP